MPPDIIKTQQEVALEALIEKHLEEVENEYEMGGLSTGLYGDYATEVAKRVVASIGRELEARCEKEKYDVPVDYVNTSWTPDELRHGESFNDGVEASRTLIRSITGITPTDRRN